MSGQRRNVVGSKRPREVFLTSTSLSFSSLSSSCASWDDAIEISTMKTSRTSYEISCVQQQQPSPSFMDECLGTHYDPERIPASVFAKTGGDANWTGVSNDSLFSLRMSTCQAFRQSDIEDEDGGEFLAYSPSLLVKTEEVEEKISQVVKETKSHHQEKSISSSSSSTPPAVSWSSANYPTSFYQLYQAPLRKAQSCPLPVGDRRESKKKKKIIWSWFSSGVLKCNLRCCRRSRELYKS